MARIRSQNTGPERLLRSALHVRGYRFRLHRRITGVRCDLAFVAARLAVFVDGCFWHGCPEHYVAPHNRAEFWAEKLNANVSRDRRQTSVLEADGWRVLRIWEHDVMHSIDNGAALVVGCLDDQDLEPDPHWQVRCVSEDDAGNEICELIELRDTEPARCAEARRENVRGRP